MKKILGPLISLILVIVVGFGAWKSYSSGERSGAASAGAASGAMASAGSGERCVKLLAGSAKFAFLQDERVVKELKANNLCLDLVKSGAFAKDSQLIGELDAVWPAGANAANDFAALIKGNQSYLIFSSPLAVASWKALVPAMEKNGLLRQVNGVGELELEKALPVMLKGTRWKDLPGNDALPSSRSILVNTPDTRKSNTGVLWVSLLAYIDNGNEVAQNVEVGQRLAAKLAPVITRQGFQEGTLAGPFEDYLGQGMGKAPMVLIYESQFFEAKAKGQLNEKHTLLYPNPGMGLKHVLVARTAEGKRVGEQLSKNAKIQQVAAEYGFRVNDPKIFEAQAKKLGLPAPELLNLAEAPATQIIEAMGQVLTSKIEGN